MEPLSSLEVKSIQFLKGVSQVATRKSTKTKAKASVTWTRGKRKLQEQHHHFVRSQIGAFVLSPSTIRDRLESKEYGEEYGFTPIKVTTGCVRKVINAIPPITLSQMQAAFLQDFTRVPLAHKKNRIEELSVLYEKVDSLVGKNGDEISDIVKLRQKLAILRQIQDEAGDDVERLIEALTSRGVTGEAAATVAINQTTLRQVSFVLSQAASGVEAVVTKPDAEVGSDLMSFESSSSPTLAPPVESVEGGEA